MFIYIILVRENATVEYEVKYFILELIIICLKS